MQKANGKDQLRGNFAYDVHVSLCGGVNGLRSPTKLRQNHQLDCS
jgi:hypothetical protein